MNAGWRLSDLPPGRPQPEDLPIPEDIAPGPGWAPIMHEMAAHIGAPAVLRLVAQFGGLRLYVPMQPEGWHIAGLIGAEKAAILSRVFGREMLVLPTARYALDHARRAGVIAAVRAGQLSLSRAAWILRINRAYVSRLAARTSEGRSTPPLANTARNRQLGLFDE